MVLLGKRQQRRDGYFDVLTAVKRFSAIHAIEKKSYHKSQDCPREIESTKVKKKDESFRKYYCSNWENSSKGASCQVLALILTF